MSETGYTNVSGFGLIDWASVPSADLVAVLAEAVLRFGRDDEGRESYIIGAAMLYSMLLARDGLGECDNCSRLIPIGVEYCGEDGEECRDDE